MKDGKKTKKWDYFSKQSIYLGRSTHHASIIILVLNTKTGRITDQYYVVLDPDFTSVDNTKSIPVEWDKKYHKIYGIATLI